MGIQGEEAFPLEIGFGLYSADLPSAIPNGYCQEAINTVCSGESQENRVGFNYVSAVDYFIEQPVTPEHTAFVFCYNDNPAYPVLAWPDGNFICFIRGSARLYSAAYTGDGFMRVNPENSIVTSIANYGTITYFCTNLGIRKIADIPGPPFVPGFNWTSDVINFTSVTTVLTGLYGMITFKDRMWAFKGNTLYFTNAATTTTNPETWSPVTQAIPVEGPGGSGEILKIIPIGARLLIFTSNGLYALTVQGEPASWVFKSLDNRSLSNHRQCAFERNNLIYYVNTLGVYVTDGYEVTKLSSSIDDKFFTAVTGNVRYSLNFLQDGMLLSMSRIFKHTNNQIYYDTTYHQMFYTRLDTIAWSEWNLKNYDTGQTGVFQDYNIATILSSSDSIYSFLSPDPLSFVLPVAGNSSVAVPLACFLQLCTYDGYLNKVRILAGANGVKQEPIHIKIRSSYSDFGQSWNISYIKYAFAEVFTSDPNYLFETWWVLDGTTDAQQQLLTVIDGGTPGEGTNLVKITAGFHSRRAGLSIHTILQSVNSQVKFKNFVAIMHTERREFKEIR